MSQITRSSGPVAFLLTDSIDDPILYFMKSEAAVGTVAAAEWHTKPNGSGPCSVCGCPAKRLKAKHRTNAEGGWEKLFSVCFGTDFSVETFGTNGWRA